MKSSDYSIRLIKTVVFIAIVSSVLSLVISDNLSTYILPELDEDTTRIFGYALKEVLMPFCTIVLASIMIRITAKSVTSPIRDLSDAAKRISNGDFSPIEVKKSGISEIDSLQESFSVMTKELQSNEYLKKEFISNVSHEFRTPLSIISGYAKVIADPELTDEERKEYAEYIQIEAERLTRMTSNILKMSKLNHQDRIDPEFLVEVNVDEIVRMSLLPLEPKWTEKNMTLSVELPELKAVGNAELLTQVFTNIIENAIKFSSDGGSIDISGAEDEDFCEVSISDHGIGMDEVTVKRVFDQFYRNERSRSTYGNGLGLPLAKRIVELHKGEIRVDSKLGEGTTFTVRLPKNKADDDEKQSDKR